MCVYIHESLAYSESLFIGKRLFTEHIQQSVSFTKADEETRSTFLRLLYLFSHAYTSMILMSFLLQSIRRSDLFVVLLELFVVLLERTIRLCCSVLQHVAACCSMLQRVAACCSVLQCVAVCCIKWQCAALCVGVLQALAHVSHESLICVLY